MNPINDLLKAGQAPVLNDLARIVMFLQQSGRVQTARLAGVIILTPDVLPSADSLPISSPDSHFVNLEALWNEELVPGPERAEILRRLLEAHLQALGG